MFEASGHGLMDVKIPSQKAEPAADEQRRHDFGAR